MEWLDNLDKAMNSTIKSGTAWAKDNKVAAGAIAGAVAGLPFGPVGIVLGVLVGVHVGGKIEESGKPPPPVDPAPPEAKP